MNFALLPTGRLQCDQRERRFIKGMANRHCHQDTQERAENKSKETRVKRESVNKKVNNSKPE